jgi:hypothetical protein
MKISQEIRDVANRKRDERNQKNIEGGKEIIARKREY